MNKGFFITFAILIALPVILCATAICYVFFKDCGVIAGVISVVVCLLAFVAAAIMLRKRSLK